MTSSEQSEFSFSESAPKEVQKNQTESKIISVAVPRPLSGLFTYKISETLTSLVRVGGWVQVPFGEKSLTHAFIVEPPKSLEEIPKGLSVDQLKSVISVGDSELRLTEDVIRLCRWASDYYFTPLGEILNGAIPSSVIKGGPQKRKRKEKEFEKNTKVDRVLTPAQEEVLKELDELRRTPDAKSVALLHGVTGSGKTEIYIELAKKVLAENKTVLVLVPEIALTPQLYSRFEQGLGVEVGLWHSAVSAGKRRQLLEKLKSSTIRVVIGARSAVFAPLLQLGLIIVDEEHDPTFKQEERARYHARDLAIVRAKFTQAFVLLGSATPSVESRERAREGKFGYVHLPGRVAPGGMPKIEIVNLRTEERVENTQAPFALKTMQAIQETLQAGEQVIVYLNRRGFAAFLLCQECGDVENCPHCSISMTLHRKRQDLRCHVCGYQQEIPVQCKKCQGTQLKPMGAGTESLEEDLPRWIPEAKICRLDRDQITSVSRLTSVLDQFRRRETNILLGTQMLVKGHDFPGVTLVVVVLADALFRWPDFRASERAFQILTQVGGRAGRGEKPGKVMIQTFDPIHPILQVLSGDQSEEQFFEMEREMRQVLRYPPFGRLARIRIEFASRSTAIDRAKKTAEYLEKIRERNPNTSLEILGPSEAFLEKAKGIYRWDIVLKAMTIQELHGALDAASGFAASQKWRMQMSIDVDPIGL